MSACTFQYTCIDLDDLCDLLHGKFGDATSIREYIDPSVTYGDADDTLVSLKTLGRYLDVGDDVLNAALEVGLSRDTMVSLGS